MPNTEVLLDGVRIEMPEGWESLPAIRHYLERLALERQRFLCALEIKTRLVADESAPNGSMQILQVKAQTLPPERLPSQVIQTARGQVATAVSQVESLVAQVLINNGAQARELWWHAAQELKAPLLTLSTFSATAAHPTSGDACAMTLRRWELQQLATLLKEVDLVALSDDVSELATVLEQRILPWLAGLGRTLELLYTTLQAEEKLFSA